MDAGKLSQMLTDAGACAVAFAPLRPVDHHAWESYSRWIATGGHASMAYLANHSEIRRNPALLLDDGPQPGGTVVCAAFAYASDVTFRPGALRIARYALGDDYHEVLRRRLQPVADAILAATGHPARICVDSAPILERYWAVQSGLGFTGRNRQLIIPGIGSHIFLTELVTRAEFTPYGIPIDRQCPEGCDRCLRACPNHALTASNRQPWRGSHGEAVFNRLTESCGFDARRCLSYQTIENRGPIPPGIASAMGNSIYGCDRCQAACPHNARAPKATAAELQPDDELMAMRKADWHALTPDRYRRLFKGSAVKRCKYEGLMRNIKAAAGGDDASGQGESKAHGTNERGPTGT